MDGVLQEAYLRAFRGLPRFRGEARLGTWLYRIVYNACLDELERSSRAAPIPLEQADVHADPRDTAFALAERDALANARD